MGLEWVAGIALLSVLGAVAARFFNRKLQEIRAAEYIVENQSQVATDDELDDFLAMAALRGQRDAFLHDLSGIRRTFGHGEVTLGHLMWIDMKLSGRAPVDSVAPAYSPQKAIR